MADKRSRGKRDVRTIILELRVPLHKNIADTQCSVVPTYKIQQAHNVPDTLNTAHKLALQQRCVALM